MNDALPLLRRLRRHASLVRFLLTSASSLLDVHGSPWRVVLTFASSLRNRGFKPAVARLLADAAYARRNDVELYRSWLANPAPMPLPAGSEPDVDKVDVVAQFGFSQAEGIEPFAAGLAGAPWVNRLFLVEPEEGIADARLSHPTDLQVIPLTLDGEGWQRLAEYDLTRSVVVTVVPGLFSEFFGAVVTPECADGCSVYFDHDLLSDGGREQPYFKPWQQSHFWVDPRLVPAIATPSEAFLRAAGVERVRTGPLHLLILACLRLTEPVHIPRPLYHLLGAAPDWRDVYGTWKDLLPQDVLDKTTVNSSYPELYRVAPRRLKATIIIPTRDRLDLLVPCFDSVVARSADVDVEIVVLDNRSSHPETLDWLAERSSTCELELRTCDYDFNWSRLTNDGIEDTDGDVVILLNNDTEVVTSDWIDRLVMLSVERGRGTVGPLLIYPDGRIQHAGIVAGFGGYADHIYAGEPASGRPTEIFASPLVRREVLATTGACLAFSRNTYEAVGRFDERLSVAGDLDFCLRAIASGLQNVFDPSIVLVHKESETRAKGLPRHDRDILDAALVRAIPRGDPYYNPNLSLRSLSPMLRLEEDADLSARPG